MADNENFFDLKSLKDAITISSERSRLKLKNRLSIYEIIAEKETICQESQAQNYVLWPFDNEEMETVNLILIGETGKGKTTIINGILNFIMKITYKNVFRLSVPVDNLSADKRNVDSQTEVITLYTIPYVEGMPYKNNFVLIDTPGLLDTHGPKCQKQNLDRINLFLNDNFQLEKCFIGIVVEANLPNSFNANKLIHEIEKIVGELLNVEIILIATFADFTKPKCFNTLEKLNMDVCGKFTFNNRIIFSSINDDEDFKEDWESWENSMTALLDCITQRLMIGGSSG
ncbi:unnamed protein product, partial [Meganyctiphanes norvegica]